MTRKEIAAANATMADNPPEPPPVAQGQAEDEQRQDDPPQQDVRPQPVADRPQRPQPAADRPQRPQPTADRPRRLTLLDALPDDVGWQVWSRPGEEHVAAEMAANVGEVGGHMAVSAVDTNVSQRAYVRSATPAAPNYPPPSYQTPYYNPFGGFAPPTSPTYGQQQFQPYSPYPYGQGAPHVPYGPGPYRLQQVKIHAAVNLPYNLIKLYFL